MMHTKPFKIIVAWLILSLPVFSAYSQVKTQVSISGKISNNIFTSAILSKIGQDIAVVNQSAISSEGAFSITQDISTPDFYKLEFDKSNFIMLILKPGEVVDISLDAKDFMKNLKISGSPESIKVLANQRIIDNAKVKLDSISTLSYQVLADSKRDSLMKLFQASFYKVNLSKKVALTNFMVNNTTSLANLFLLDAFPIDDNMDAYLKLDAGLYKAYPDNIYVGNLHNQIVAAQKTQIGSLAPDFTLPDTSGVNFTLSSLKGKYVLVDFWASWCGPCMKEMPNVIKLYSDFHKKGLEIVGVSLDKSRPSWLNAIKTKDLAWIMVSDVKYWQSMVVPLYNVSAIPYTVLLDKEGKIIAKNLRGDDLYRKVQTLLQ
jgi:peroxiredoxin